MMEREISIDIFGHNFVHKIDFLGVEHARGCCLIFSQHARHTMY